MKTFAAWQEMLGLSPHPEGGFYKRTEESQAMIEIEGKTKRLYTSIYFLLTPTAPSHFHRLTADEIWYYHEGQALTVHCIFPNGDYQAVSLGKNLAAGERLHYLVPKGTIFGSTVAHDYALVSCVVVPGFEFSDFELFTQAELLKKYPQHQEIIKKLAYKIVPQ